MLASIFQGTGLTLGLIPFITFLVLFPVYAATSMLWFKYQTEVSRKYL
ncbi:MAG: hypothetical protein ACI9P5_003207 [Saprospiraceae bacterium]|jgi:hypothetical protein|tara:strand:+ start:135 stop:278 length:144 start_codon:yes stop_codon:yes gene_type:complete